MIRTMLSAIENRVDGIENSIILQQSLTMAFRLVRSTTKEKIIFSLPFLSVDWVLIDCWLWYYNRYVPDTYIQEHPDVPLFFTKRHKRMATRTVKIKAEESATSAGEGDSRMTDIKPEPTSSSGGNSDSDRNKKTTCFCKRYAQTDWKFWSVKPKML